MVDIHVHLFWTVQHVEVVMEQLSAEAFCPAYFIAIGHEQKCVLLVIRGTNQMADLFTDLNGGNESLSVAEAISCSLFHGHLHMVAIIIAMLSFRIRAT